MTISTSHPWCAMKSIVREPSPNAPTSISASLYEHRWSRAAVVMRLCFLPVIAVGAGVLLAGPAVLFWTSLLLAALAGWLATYSP